MLDEKNFDIFLSTEYARRDLSITSSVYRFKISCSLSESTIPVKRPHSVTVYLSEDTSGAITELEESH